MTTATSPMESQVYRNGDITTATVTLDNHTKLRDGGIFERHSMLVQWLQNNEGYIHPNIKIAFAPGKGFHAVVANDQVIESETRIASCPMSLTISVLNALDASPFNSHGTRFPQAFLKTNLEMPELLQTFFLMEQCLLGSESWWEPYVQTLPSVEDVQNLQFEDPDDMLWIEGTNLKGGVAMQTTKWRDMYTRGIELLQKLKWPNALNGAYSWELYRWAATMFGSRSFTSQVLSDTLPADQARPAGRHDGDYGDLVKLFSEQFGVLLPVLDLLNHRPVAKIEWQARASFVGLQVLETYKSGEELCNNYGPRDNEGLLLAYGFTIDDNAFDHVVISIRAPPGSPLADAHTWEKDVKSDPEYKSYIFNINHPRALSVRYLEASIFSFDLLDSISVLCGNDRELQAMYMSQRTLMSEQLGDTGKIEDFRNLLSTVCQVLRDCKARAERLRATDPARFDPPRTPLSPKQKHAKAYRDSQLTIHEMAVAVCSFLLVRACTDLDTAHILQILHNQFPPHIFSQLKTLTTRHACISAPNEIFSVEKLLSSLSPSIIRSWRKLMEMLEPSLLTDLDANSPGAQHGLYLTKTRFAVLLSALCAEYSQGKPLPPNLKAWIEQLSQWYPPDDENWAYVPHKGPWAPGEDPPPALMRMLEARAAVVKGAGVEVVEWLRPERLCWGWNVMEEEGVMVPTYVTELAYPDKDPVGGDIDFLLYCKHS